MLFYDAGYADLNHTKGNKFDALSLYYIIYCIKKLSYIYNMPAGDYMGALLRAVTMLVTTALDHNIIKKLIH